MFLQWSSLNRCAASLFRKRYMFEPVTNSSLPLQARKNWYQNNDAHARSVRQHGVDMLRWLVCHTLEGAFEAHLVSRSMKQCRLCVQCSCTHDRLQSRVSTFTRNLAAKDFPEPHDTEAKTTEFGQPVKNARLRDALYVMATPHVRKGQTCDDTRQKPISASDT